MSTRCQICRSVDRWNGRFCLSLNSGRTAQYKHNAQFLCHLGLHGDVNDAHRAGANRLKNKNIHSYMHTARNKRSAAQQNTARDARVHLIHMSAPQPRGSLSLRCVVARCFCDTTFPCSFRRYDALTLGLERPLLRPRWPRCQPRSWRRCTRRNTRILGS